MVDRPLSSGLAAIDVAALSPLTGKPLDTRESSGSTGIDTIARQVLMKSDNAKIVLAALATITRAGRALAANNRLPSNYNDFCQALLGHAREFYPQTSQSCSLTQPAQDDDSPTLLTTYDEKATVAKLLTRISPQYPPEAKQKGLQGTVTFSALINKSGEIEDIGLTSGAFLLYSASLNAVRQWRHKPMLIANKPVDVRTTITVNFALSN